MQVGINFYNMSNFINNRRGQSSDNCRSKSTSFAVDRQESEVIYSDLANQDAVKTEIGEIVREFDVIITQSLKVVNDKRAEDPIKYNQRAMYATELNAEIKARILEKLGKDRIFDSNIKVRSNYGSIYFIVKDKYAVFIKKLNGKLNKPNCYPTMNSAKTFSGDLFTGTEQHIPFLFIGPNLKDEKSYVTSLISPKEVNWTIDSSVLFSNDNIVVLDNKEHDDVEVLKVKTGAKLKKRKTV